MSNLPTTEVLVRGSAILATICYAMRGLIDARGRNEEKPRQGARNIWSAGCGCLCFHVFSAFLLQHHWSHAAAWEHTRQRTLELTGFNSGDGLYANYAMTIIWLIDVTGWWTRLDWPRRFRVWYWAVQIFFAFMVVNATLVFGPWYWWIAAAVMAISILGLRRREGG